MTLFLCGQGFSQEKLITEQFLDGRYNSSKNAVVTIMKGKKLSPYSLTLYHSIALTEAPEDMKQIKKAVLEDAKDGVQVEQVISNNEVLECYMQFKPKKENDKINRFLLYRSDVNDGGMIIYMEGDTNLDSLIKLFIKKK